MTSNVPIYKIISAVAAVLVAASLFFFFGMHSGPAAPQGGMAAPGAPTAPSGTAASPPDIGSVTFNVSIYQIALARAKQWHADAALSKMTYAPASASWDFLFYSPTVKTHGFEIIVDGQKVISSSETGPAGIGASLPQNAISPDQAIAAARSVPGYASIAVTAVQMVYNASARQWFWWVTMANGATLDIKVLP